MTDVIDLSTFRLRRQLRQSVAILGATGVNGLGLPPVPNRGLHRGDFVKLESGAVGWISDQRIVDGGLVVCVRVQGRAVWVAADNVTPVSGA